MLDVGGDCEAAADDLCRGWEEVAEVGGPDDEAEGERGACCRSAGLERQTELEQPP